MSSPAMNPIDAIPSLLSTLYEAAATPERWQPFLLELSQRMQATHAYLLADAPAAPDKRSYLLHGFTPNDMQRYADHYFAQDIALERALHHVSRNGRFTGTLDFLVPTSELKKLEIYADFMVPVGLMHQISTATGPVGPFASHGVAVWRPENAKPFDAVDLQVLDVLAPHLQQALLLNARLCEMAELQQVLEYGLDASRTALVALTAQGRVTAVSPHARRLLEAGKGLRLFADTLLADAPEHDRELQQLVRGACEATSPEGSLLPPGGSLRVHTPDAGVGIIAHVRPFLSRQSGAMASTAALVLLADPSDKPPARADILRDLFGLTPVEIRLCQLLLCTESVREAAEQARLSYTTGRFHLKQIFRKCGISRQIELVQLLLSLPGSDDTAAPRP
ncbi:helix-turn-helix transcriptional regulator [Granulicella cerasi]|uniref:Helix-turn-helix transcriptional regulator n=1 Tax=Granulicella cerasi TaxID=741063 RepID=A0ABW1ZCA7_9BACT|nr:hypothetical protein [Granulicella cerasi]